MKVRLLAIACAVLGLSFAMGGTAGAVVTINVRPYVFNVLGIGATDPGDPASVLCIIGVDNANPGNNGKINGVVVSGHAGELNITLKKQDQTTNVSTCVSTAIAVTTVDPVGTAGTQAIDAAAPKTGGTLQIATAASLQPGIAASSATTVAVNLSAGQVATLPAGAILSSGSLTGPGTATMLLKTTAVATKAQLDTAACSDKQYLIDTNQHDQGGVTPRAFEIGQPLGSVPGGVTLPTQGSAGVYVATIRGCAELNVSVPGKPVTTKIKVVGNGAASVDFVKAATINPQVWDTTRGTSCSAVKAAGTFGATATDSSRVLSCKGAYGDPIPLALDVRGWTTNGGQDPYGLLHPSAPTQILSGTFS